MALPNDTTDLPARSLADWFGTPLGQYLLRREMESEGFTVYEQEWWHFDYKDWKLYPILNRTP